MRIWDKLKYVVTRDGEMIVFSCLIQHSQFAGLDPISAGFIAVDSDGNLKECYGKSISLGIGVDEKDNERLEQQIKLKYEY